MTALSPQIYTCRTVRIPPGARRVDRIPTAHASTHGLSRYRTTSGTAQRFQIWVMSPFQNQHQSQRATKKA
jgi:DNA-binding transcriptional regulator/RsmH inhibitor MraZ